MIKFPSINQFRNVVNKVRLYSAYTGSDDLGNPIYDYSRPVPTLDYVGTVKLHGTNASVVQKEAGGELQFQSRNRVVSPENDNAGFARFNIDCVGFEFWNSFFEFLRSQFSLQSDDTVVVYGEWCGKGIQKGVAISKLERMFVIIAIRVGVENDTTWFTPSQMKSIPQTLYTTGAAYRNSQAQVKMIFDFPNYEITIDFNNPKLSRNILVKLTDQVENECPVGAALGESGTGEGIVWRCITPGFEDSKFWFKVKGKKHKVSQFKTTVTVDVEKAESIHDFTESVLQEARLLQGIDYLKEMNKELSQKSTGDYIRWIVGDVIKEEADVMKASGLTPNDVKKHLSNYARKWFFEWIENEDGF